MNQILREIYNTRFVEDEMGKKYPLNSETSPSEGEYLQEIISRIKAKTTLETGMAYGLSTIWICDALKRNKGNKHIAIDPAQLMTPNRKDLKKTISADEGWRGIGLNNLKRAGLSDLLELHTQSSHLALPRLELEGTKIDFAFIDGMHTFDYAFIDFFYIDRILKPGGVIVFDDICIPAVNKVCRYALRNRAYSLYEKFNKVTLSASKRFFLALPFLGKKIRNNAKQEFLIPDYILGLSNRYYIALIKERDDLITDGASEISRNWDHYEEF